jgi:hypothetical protein
MSDGQDAKCSIAPIVTYRKVATKFQLANRKEYVSDYQISVNISWAWDRAVYWVLARRAAGRRKREVLGARWRGSYSYGRSVVSLAWHSL